MIIKVEISEETWARMLTGKRVEGTIGLDQWTGKKNFNAFNRHRKKCQHDRLIKKLPWGWVKESKENVKVFESVPKAFGLPKILQYLDEDHQVAKDALIDEALDQMVFC